MSEHHDTAVASVLGAGSWGTALAIQLARHGGEVRLWGRDADALAAMQSARENTRYLPGARWPDNLNVAPELDAALDGVQVLLLNVPSHALRSVLQQVAERMQEDTRSRLHLCWATKGFELDTGLLVHEVVEQVLPGCASSVVLSGPSFAKEVGLGLPTAITAAGPTLVQAARVADRFSTPHFRVYTSDDIVGVEIGGAVKNVLAIAAGFSDGLGFGANARVALINRGLGEMARLGAAMGARPETFMGLACMGDLVLTCTDDQSRNRRMGLALARGQGVQAAIEEIGQVVEGVKASRAVYEKAESLGLDLRIVTQVYRVLHEEADPEEAVRMLLARTPGVEHEDIA